jgi:hypothetical protein
MLLPGLVGPSYLSASPAADPSECINWLVEAMLDANAKSEARLAPAPGFSLVATLAPGPIRAQFKTTDDRLFVISGYNLYELDSSYTATLRGTVSLDGFPATICSNGAAGGQLFITSGDLGYCYDLGSNTLTTELASGARMGAYLNNRFIALNADLSLFRISAIDDGTSWDPTEFFQRSLAGDPWVSLKVVNSELWLLGSLTSEVWTPDEVAIFAPIPGAFFNMGNGSPFSMETINSILVWVGQSTEGSNTIVRANGYAAERISTHPVEADIQSFINTSDAVSFSYTDQGHAFWVCNFVDGGISWTWDAATNLWHKRGYWNSVDSTYEALRVGTHCAGFAKTHVVGDRESGALYLMDATVATDVDGQGIRRLRQFRGPESEGEMVFVPKLQIDCQTGIGLATGQGDDPQAMLQVSRDGGRTWDSELWQSMGKMGQYGLEVIWRRLGCARNFVFRLVVSDPVYPVTLFRAILHDTVKGTS